MQTAEQLTERYTMLLNSTADMLDALSQFPHHLRHHPDVQAWINGKVLPTVAKLREVVESGPDV